MEQVRAAKRRTGPMWWSAAVAASVLLLLVSATTGVPGGTRRFGAYLDATVEANLPTWWSTALCTAAALAHAVAAVAARAAAASGARYWAVGALVVTGLSLAEHTSVHDLVAAAVAPGGPVVMLAGAAALAALGLVAVGLGGRAGALIASGAALMVIGAAGGEIATGAVLIGAGQGSDEHILVTHLAELAENVGVLVLLAAAATRLTVVRRGAAIEVRYRREHPARPGPRPSATRPIGWRGAWTALAITSAALSAASLTVVLLAPWLEPGRRDLRLYLDVLVEDNLPTWWSSALLLVAAGAHALAGAVGRGARAPGASGWFVSAGVLAVLSLDDHTGLHERSETVGRWLAASSSYPFLWLIPGAVAGVAVAAVITTLAVRSPARTRYLLVAGVGVLLGCALGLEAVQGVFMQAGDEGVAFVATYHLEELGENVAALLLGAAASAVTVTAADGRVVVAPALRPGRHPAGP